MIFSLGSSHGRIGERENLHALPHLVRPPAPWMPVVRRACVVKAGNLICTQLEQSRFSHLAPWRDHRRRTKPRPLPRRSHSQLMGLRRSGCLYGFLPLDAALDHLSTRRCADLRFRGQRA